MASREAGNVDEPDDRFDSDGGADAQHEVVELLVGKLIAQTVQRFADPCNGASLTQGKRVSFGHVGFYFVWMIRLESGSNRRGR